MGPCLIEGERGRERRGEGKREEGDIEERGRGRMAATHEGRRRSFHPGQDFQRSAPVSMGAWTLPDGVLGDGLSE